MCICSNRNARHCLTALPSPLALLDLLFCHCFSSRVKLLPHPLLRAFHFCCPLFCFASCVVVERGSGCAVVILFPRDGLGPCLCNEPCCSEPLCFARAASWRARGRLASGKDGTVSSVCVRESAFRLMSPALTDGGIAQTRHHERT